MSVLKLRRLLAGLLMVPLVCLASLVAAAEDGAVWQVIVHSAVGQPQTQAAQSLPTAELTDRLQPLGVNSRLTATGLELSGIGLEELRSAVFVEAAAVADILGGALELAMILPSDQQSITLELESRPSTGAVWQFSTDPVQPGVQMTESSIEMRYPAVGAPSVQRFSFSLDSVSGGELRMVYRRPFQSDTPVYATLRIQLANPIDLIQFTNPTPNQPLNGGAATQNRLSPLATLPVQTGLPSTFDSRQRGIVPPVRDQGYCGSCWAFSTVGIMEIAVALGGGPLTDLSEQFLVSCNTDGYSCNGGSFANAYHYNKLGLAQTQIGAVLELDEPYTATNGSCTIAYTHPYRASATESIVDWSGIASNEQIKSAIMAYGAVETAVCSEGWSDYLGGVFDPATNDCGGGVDHAVVLVGWDDVTETWLVRNSWSDDWGEAGYIRLKYDPDGKTSMIGIAADWIQYHSPARPAPVPALGGGALGVLIILFLALARRRLG